MARLCLSLVALVLSVASLHVSCAAVGPRASSLSDLWHFIKARATGSTPLQPLEPSVPDFIDVDDNRVVAHWALIVAGSYGWWNYRHQADACHAYQVLRAGGLHPSRIVMMMYNDIAKDPNNIMQGQVFNRPGGPDVYIGAHNIDYRGPDVTAQNLLNVLEGRGDRMLGIGSGKVIKSGPNDRVFMFFSDHGSPGVLGMPTGPFLYADQLLASITRKHVAGAYREMVLYIEACESGSMFEGLLNSSMRVYAATAANSEESSWGCYCPGMDPDVPAGLDTCLGDLFAVSWMEDTELEDSTVQTLQGQFALVKNRTSDGGTYTMGSHAMQYGAFKKMGKEHTGSYLGLHQPGVPSTDLEPAQPSWRRRLARHSAQSSSHRHPQLHHRGHVAKVAQREADLVPLRVAVARAASPQARAHAQAALDREVGRRASVDQGLLLATAHLLSTPGHARRSLLRELSTVGAEGQGDLQMGDASGVLQMSQALMAGRYGRTVPLVKDWDCLRGMVAAYAGQCGAMDQYAMKHTRLFASLCNLGVQPASLAHSLVAAQAC